ILSIDNDNLNNKNIDTVLQGLFSELLVQIEDQNRFITKNIEFDKNGEKRILEVKVHKIFSNDKKDSCILLSIDDISEKIELEEKLMLQSKQAEMGDMIAMIAHQWKQPLSIISTISSGIQVGIDMNNELNSRNVYNFMTQIEEQVMYMSDTIDDFRNYLKPETKPQVVTISNLVTKVLSIIGKTLANKEIGVETLFNCDFKLNIYINELIHVLLNLLGNAKNAIIKNNTQDAKIVLTTDEDDDNYYLNIKDNGGGIDDSIMDKIGKKYFTTDKYEGTGLGIYMSKKIIKKHLNTDIELKNINNGLCVVLIFKKGMDYIVK
ncbi:MAG: HAMP domain-containing sensor histidine kinase, partial [Campylobacterota bacterium]|nr:HAMP domain-containing sensor histidine kinase [Campylobacterota bacterium]